MAGITLAQAEAQLASYLTAETAVLSNQAYSINGRSMTRADLAAIREGISHWDSRVRQLASGGIRARGATPVTN